MGLYGVTRWFLFLMKPETAHHFTANFLHYFFKVPGVKTLTTLQFRKDHPALKTELFGLTFNNPVGLAAGFDKDAQLFDELSCLGFGFIEIGTVTPKPQPGNEKPRMFRLKGDSALLNRMGFNNEGVTAAALRLRKRKTDIIIGGNIGKNKLTANENAVDDYLKCYKELYDVVDYFAVNVSSPNTPDLRALQDKEPLLHLLQQIMKLNSEQKKPKPVLLKIAPDLNHAQLDDIIDIVKTTKVNGIIATNTTIDRGILLSERQNVETYGTGGLSGKPLAKKSTEVIKYLTEKSEGTIPVIGVGGIHCAEDAIEKMQAGASLVQIYTGFIYEGPSLIKRINKAILAHRLKK